MIFFKKVHGAILVSLIIFMASCGNIVETVERQQSDGILGSICVVSDEYTIDFKGKLIDSVFQTPVIWNFQSEAYFEFFKVSTKKFFPYFANQKTVVVLVNEDNVNNILETFDVDKYKIKKAVLNDKITYIRYSNIYAENQYIIFVCGASQTLVFSELLRNPHNFLQMIEKYEIKTELARRNTRKSKHDLHQSNLLKKKGYKIKIPNNFHSALKSDTINWYKIEYGSGNSNLLTMTIPDIGQKITTDYIYKLQNKLGKMYLTGNIKNSFVQTEPKSVFPHMLEETTINQSKSYVMRSWWGMQQGEFIGGPCVTYLIKDKANKQYVLLHGFIYSPSQDMGKKKKFKNRKVPKMRNFDVIARTIETYP